MSIDDSSKEFQHISETVFIPQRTNLTIFKPFKAMVGTPWFDGEILENAVKDLLDRRKLDKDESLEESGDPACKVYVEIRRCFYLIFTTANLPSTK